MHFVRVPSLAENVEEATLGEWLREPGEKIDPGDAIAELFTEKAEFTLHVEPDVEGVLLECLAQDKSVLPVGFILCVVGDPDQRDLVKQAMGENAALLARRAKHPTVAVRAVDVDAAAPQSTPGRGVRATPAARRLAKEKGVDLEDVAETLHLKGAVKEEHIRTYLDEC